MQEYMDKDNESLVRCSFKNYDKAFALSFLNRTSSSYSSDYTPVTKYRKSYHMPLKIKQEPNTPFLLGIWFFSWRVRILQIL